MADGRKPRPAPERIEAWLASRHGAGVAELAPLSGGFWSSAYSYRVGAEPFVLRLSELREGFEIDAAAMRFAGPRLPVPEVLETGRALGACYAISRRHFGRFVEDTAAGEAAAVGAALGTLLEALRAVPATPADPVKWYDPPGTPGPSWRDWLGAGLADDPSAHVRGWRAKLASSAPLDALFRRCESRIAELLPACPERRDLVHGDLLHQNVLVAEQDASRVTGVFSWKCSVRGDFLFDVAWCTFWGPWHPAVAAADLWQRTLTAPDLAPADLADAQLRHHCYELQIAASHLGWNAFVGDDHELAAVARAAEALLERGPRA